MEISDKSYHLIQILRQYPKTGQVQDEPGKSSQNPDIDDQKYNLKEVLKSAKGLEDLATAGTLAYSSLAQLQKGFIQAQRGMGELYSVNLDYLKLLKDQAKEATFLEQRYLKLNKAYGVSSIQAGQYGKVLEDVSAELKIGGLHGMAYASSLSKILPLQLKNITVGSKNVKQNDALTRSLLKTQDVLQAKLQLSEDDAAAYQLYTAIRAEDSDQHLAMQAEISEQIEKTTGLTGVLQTITSGVATMASNVRVQFGRIPGNLEVAVLKARMLGTSVEEIYKTGRGTLDIEKSVNSELEYQAVTGQRIVDENGKNLINELRIATAQGNANKMLETRNKIIRTQGKFLDGNLYAQESMGEILSLETGELMKQRELLAQMDKYGLDEGILTLDAGKFEEQITAHRQALVDMDDPAKRKELEDILNRISDQADVRTTEDVMQQLGDVITAEGVNVLIKDFGQADASGIIEGTREAFIKPGVKRDKDGNIKSYNSVMAGAVDNLASIGKNADATTAQIAGAYTTFSQYTSDLTKLNSNIIQAIPGIGGLVTLLKELELFGYKVGEVFEAIKPSGMTLGVESRSETFELSTAGNVTVNNVRGLEAGGPVAAGVPVIVGEAGPEVFVPDNSGAIIPNNQLASTGGTSTNQKSTIDRASIRDLTDAIRNIRWEYPSPGMNSV